MWWGESGSPEVGVALFYEGAEVGFVAEEVGYYFFGGGGGAFLELFGGEVGEGC